MEDLDLGLEERPKKAKGGLSFIVFLIGIAVGVAGTLLAPRYLSSYLPAGLRGGREAVEGPVMGKRQEEGRLLLTVNAQQGAVLATFSERVAEIDLLVDVGDTITLGVAGYEPFIDNPAFRGIRKATRETSATRQPADSEARRSGDAAGEGEAVFDGTSKGADREGAEDPNLSPLGLPRSDQEEAPGDTLEP